MLAQYFRYTHVFSGYVKPTARRGISPPPANPFAPRHPQTWSCFGVWLWSPSDVSVLLWAMRPEGPGDWERAGHMEKSEMAFQFQLVHPAQFGLILNISIFVHWELAFGLTNQLLNTTASERNINNCLVLTCFTKSDPSFSGSSRHFSNSPKKKLKQEEKY